MFKRVKAKPAQRARASSPEDANDSGNKIKSTEESPSTIATKLKAKSKKAKTSRLSFGGDNEDGDSAVEEFKLKKSRLSQKMSLGTHPANLPVSLDQATISPNRGPTYSKADLDELKASTPTSRPPPQSDPYDADMSMNIDDTSILSIENADFEDGKSMEIPSESSITFAKERRERLRGIQGQDFISLDVSIRDSGPSGPHPNSRLMREEDELGEGDDEYAEYTSAQERIALGKKSKKKEAADRRNAMIELIADAEEEDEETKEWENEQIRRGGLQPSDTRAPKPKPTYKPAPIPLTTSLPTLDNALTRLSHQLAQLTTSHAQNTTSLNSLSRDRTDLDQRENELRGMVQKAEEKRAWFSSFRDWLETVATFLDEKYPQLEKLEDMHISYLKDRHSRISQRRQADDEDDLSVFLGPLEPRTEGTSSAPAEKALRRTNRLSRRLKRQTRFPQKTEKEEGYSSDDTLPSEDETDYKSAVATLVRDAEGILSDVKAPEFLDPSKGRWAVWRQKYRDSYVNAWGGLGVISVWEFWARLECLGWDCLEDGRTLDTFRWYQDLFDYSRPSDTDEAGESSLGPDGELEWSMVTTAIVPRIAKVLEAGLDPYSERDIQRTVNLLEELELNPDHDATKLQNLYKTVFSAFHDAVQASSSLVTAHIGSTQRVGFSPDAIPARRRFLCRQVHLLHNILRWRKHAANRFGYGIDRDVEKLINACILPIAESGWDVGGADIVKAAARTLPQELMTASLRAKFQSW